MDLPLTFFFAASKGESIHRSYCAVLEVQENADFAAAKATYTLYTRRQLGLGWFYSFMPGTTEFWARVAYSRIQRHLSQTIQEQIFTANLPISVKALSWVSLTPLYFLGDLVKNVLIILTSLPQQIKYNNALSSHQLISFFPFIKELMLSTNRQHLVQQLLWSIVNPFRLISSFFEFLHYMINNCFDSANQRGLPSSILRQTAKLVGAILIVPLRLFSIILEESVNLVMKGMFNVTIEPIVFIYLSIIQAINYRNKSFISTTVDEVRGVKVIQQLFETNANESTQSFNQIWSDARLNVPNTEFISKPRIFGRKSNISPRSSVLLIVDKQAAKTFSDIQSFFNQKKSSVFAEKRRNKLISDDTVNEIKKELSSIKVCR